MHTMKKAEQRFLLRSVCAHMLCVGETRRNTEIHHNKQKATMQHTVDQGDLNTKARINVTVQNIRGKYKLGQTNEYSQI